jgi:hypothetical protein
MSVQRISQVYNPITGVFGNGFVQVFGPGMSGTWTVPPGVNACRVRLWGGGGFGGGGFALKTIYALGVTSVAVTVGGNFQTSSFGSFVSASPGLGSAPYTGGSGSGGDINTTGGTGNASVGGGAASLFGNGGNAGSSTNGQSSASGGGSNTSGAPGGSGLTGVGGSYVSAATSFSPSNIMSLWSLDFIGTGPGGGMNQPGFNGGGSAGNGGFPGGGGGVYPAPGLVIVEW